METMEVLLASPIAQYPVRVIRHYVVSLHCAAVVSPGSPNLTASTPLFTLNSQKPSLSPSRLRTKANLWRGSPIV